MDCGTEVWETGYGLSITGADGQFRRYVKGWRYRLLVLSNDATLGERWVTALPAERKRVRIDIR